MKSIACCALSTSLILVGVVRASDGVLISRKMTSAAGQQTVDLQVDKTHVRTESKDPTGASRVILFDAAKQALYIISPAEKTYSELTKADSERMGGMRGQSADANAQLQAQLANLPPEQRAMAEKMMAGRMGGAGMGGAMARPQYRKTGTDTVGKWTCDKYEGTVNGQKTSEVCTVDPTSLGISLGDLQVMQQFADFFQKAIPMAGAVMQGLGRGDDGLSGFPVKTVTRTPDGGTATSELTAASRQSFDDAIFAVPAGFQKVEFGMGRGRQ